MLHARRSFPLVRSLACAVVAGAGLLSLAAGPQDPAGGKTDAPRTVEVDARWLERLDALDRTLADQNIGFAPPAFTDEMKWANTDALSWDKLRGKVVVLQSWTSKQGAQRSVPARLTRQFEKAGDDVVTLFIHTPEGADDGEKFIERLKVDAPMAIDPTGAFLDELGIYREPVNVVIDRNGEVRYAGLNTRGLTQAVDQLLAEKLDESKKPAPRATEVQSSSASDAKFPTFTNNPQSQRDLRGQRAPDFYVEEWISQPVNPRGKVLVVEFSATWCGPCIAMLPHMNDLANQFRGDVEVMWITNETPQKFIDGMKNRNLTPQSFAFPVASDPDTRMMKAVGASGWPTALVISSDWVVRWQGHPQYLKSGDLKQIVEANRALVGNDSARYRWTGN